MLSPLHFLFICWFACAVPAPARNFFLELGTSLRKRSNHFELRLRVFLPVPFDRASKTPQ